MNKNRLSTLLLLSKEYRSDAAFADAVGISASFFGQIKRGERNVGEKLARRIEVNLGLQPGSLDLISNESDFSKLKDEIETLSKLDREVLDAFQNLTDDEKRMWLVNIATYKASKNK